VTRLAPSVLGASALTPRARIQAALRGEWADRVPFSVYWLMFPRGDVERRLRNDGVAIVERVPVYRVEMPNTETVVQEYYRDGKRMMTETVRTPVGQVQAVRAFDPSYGTSWFTREFYFKGPNDYPVLEFMVADTQYIPTYDAVSLAQERLGEDGYVIGNTGYGPMNRLLVEWFGVEQFSLELRGRPDRLLGLYRMLVQSHREMYSIAAASPAEMLIYDGNIHQDVAGLKRFEAYYVPCLNEFADVLHERGKLAACHLDANMKTLVEAVGRCRMDVVEAFTPVPTCDVTVTEARAAWPDKVLWINFPSSVLLQPGPEIQTETLRILREAAPGNRFLIGITEDVPEDRWRDGLATISQTLLEHGVLPLPC
jgi:hypothetical protein